jgi:hypothetical protein
LHDSRDGEFGGVGLNPMAESSQPQAISRRKRWLFGVITGLLVIALCALALEIAATAYQFVAQGKYISARTRFASRTNTFIQDLTLARDCS